MENNKQIPTDELDYIPIDELPRWAYDDEAWELIEEMTIEIVDGVRMGYDYDKWREMKLEASLDELGIF